MKISWKEDRYGIMGMLSFSTMMLCIALLTDGTGDEGDSVYHFLFARYASRHPQHFLDHWAKPFYTLVAFPFAQYGFMCVKLMNTAFTCMAVWFTYLIARVLGYRWAPAVFLLAASFKLLVIFAFSGLTEPLHDMMISVAIYLAFTRRYAWAAVIVSFLPFVRSEGLFLCGLFALLFIWQRQWKAIPLLALGHVLYSLAGYPYYHNLLWVFTRIPYARIDAHYGHGDWLSFVRAMPYLTAPVGCALLVSGMTGSLAPPLYLFLRGQCRSIRVEPLFIAAIFAVFFMMHTTFWALGIFGSFGMMRVFVAVGCVMLLLMLAGLELMDDLLAHFIKTHSAVLAAAVLISGAIFAFGASPFSYFKSDFGLHADQLCQQEAIDLIRHTYPDQTGYTYFFDAKYVSLVLDKDVFDPTICRPNSDRDSASYPPKSFVIWDDWYSAFEAGFPLDSLRRNKSLREVRTFARPGAKGAMRRTVLFVRE